MDPLYPSCLGIVALPLAGEATASACHVTVLSCHPPLPWGATCPWCSLTRCSQSMFIRLGFSGDIDRGHLPVHEFQEVREEKVTKALPGAPEGAGHLSPCRSKNADIHEGLTAKS